MFIQVTTKYCESLLFTVLQDTYLISLHIKQSNLYSLDLSMHRLSGLLLIYASSQEHLQPHRALCMNGETQYTDFHEV
jgi:hypothetical protein